MWLSVPYSQCPTPYSCMFSSRCPTWNSIYIRSWADLHRVEKKANVVICAFTGYIKSYCSWNTQNSMQMWLSVPYSEFPSRVNLAPVGVHKIQDKCSYLCLTPSASLSIAVCSVQVRKFGYSDYSIRSRTCGHTELSEVKPRYPECPTLNISTIRSRHYPASYKILLRLERLLTFT